MPTDVARRRAAELIEALELTGMEKRTVMSLSGGQQRRLDVAMGLMNRPRLLFLDEPTTGWIRRPAPTSGSTYCGCVRRTT